MVDADSLVRGEIPNAETIAAIEEVRHLKEIPNKKTYGSFAEIMQELISFRLDFNE